MRFLAAVSLRNVIVRNTLILSLSQASVYIIPLVTLPYVARVLGAEHFGLLGIASNIIGNLLIFTDWGFSLSATREVARNAKDPHALRKIFWNTVAAKCMLGLASLIVTIIIVACLGYSSMLAWIVLCGWLQVAASSLGVGWFLQGLEAMGTMAAGVLIGRLLIIPLTFIFVRGPADTMLVLVIAGFCGIISVSINFYNALRLRRLRPIAWTFAGAWQQLSNSWHIFMSTGATTFYTQLNVLILGMAAGPMQAGLLYGAEKLQRAGKSLVQPMAGAFYPRINNLLTEHPDRAIRLVKRLLIFQGTITFLFSIALLVSAPFLISLFLGPGYEGAIPALRFLSWTVFFVGLSNVLGIQIMLPFGMQRSFMRIIVSSAMFNILSIVPLSYFFGAAGASMSILLTEVIVTAAMGFAVWRAGILSGKGMPV
ncbi:MAG: flippase [Beijerinckiaceae bacterium]|nr:flippase [Beijerinckiaceae bacterium]